ncbi:MAG TPA: RnfABCDGE type electron transport complex subunit B [Gammaproteobacteria bacterium]|nr:RnfABCDGE type electron transport complex subunit B [Gammaproteobacteria bacterium]
MQANADAVDALLPQQQCRRCGYEGCRPYAEAIAAGKARINRCPPGGTLVIDALAALLDTQALALDPAVGTIEPTAVARIDAKACIGCTKCLPACPVDAIVGAPKLLHDVLDAACTGCGLCLPPCPVDCITLLPGERVGDAEGRRRASPDDIEAERGRMMLRAEDLRRRYVQHELRLSRGRRSRRHALDDADAEDLARRRAEIAAAVARVRTARAAAR